jgi:hypothetical protein
MRKFLCFTALLLVGCGEGSLSNHFKIQDSLVAQASMPSGISSVSIDEEITLGVRRGVVNDLYAVRLGSGEYTPIIKSEAGVFYLSPWGAFEYKTNQKVKSKIGGVFIRNVDGSVYPWFIYEQFEQDEWLAWKVGERISMIFPGMLGLPFKPYVELDIEVPRQLFK